MEVTHEPRPTGALPGEPAVQRRHAVDHRGRLHRRRRVLAVDHPGAPPCPDEVLDQQRPAVEQQVVGSQDHRRRALVHGLRHVPHPLGACSVGAVLHRCHGEEHVERARLDLRRPQLLVVPGHRLGPERPEPARHLVGRGRVVVRHRLAPGRRPVEHPGPAASQPAGRTGERARPVEHPDRGVERGAPPPGPVVQEPLEAGDEGGAAGAGHPLEAAGQGGGGDGALEQDPLALRRQRRHDRGGVAVVAGDDHVGEDAEPSPQGLVEGASDVEVAAGVERPHRQQVVRHPAPPARLLQPREQGVLGRLPQRVHDRHAGAQTGQHRTDRRGEEREPVVGHAGAVDGGLVHLPVVLEHQLARRRGDLAEQPGIGRAPG